MANLLLKIDSICRTCLKEAVNCKSLLTKMEYDDRTVCEFLSFITSFDIIISEKYPKQICNECFIMVRNIEEFKKRCIQSETLLKNGYLNCTTFVGDFVKQDIISNSNMCLPLRLNENNLLKNKSLSPQYVDIEIPSTVNMDDSISIASDTLEIYVSNEIKKEKDDFLEEDMEVLTNSILTDKIDLPKISLVSLPKVIECECGKKYENIKQMNSHLQECKKEETSINIYNDNISIVKEEFPSTDILRNLLSINKNAQNVCDFDQNFTNNIHNSNKDDFSEVDSTYSSENSATKILVENTPKIKQISSKNDSSERTQNETFKQYTNDEHRPIALSCPHCALVAPDVNSFEKHLEKHKQYVKDTDYQCSLCAEKFLTRTLLTTHLDTHQNKDDHKYVCITCNREFKHEAHLSNHIETAHAKMKGFKCDSCSKSFSNEESLDFHKQQHTNRKYQCNVCSKTFTIHSVLNEHLRTHTGEKPFLCSICGRGFTQKNNLAQHMRRHQGLKPYKCSNCDRSFVSKGELEAHTRKHTGKHPFVCDECGNRFTTSSSLTKHRRIHTGEKRYACDLCSMRFTALGTLKNHRRTHTGEKPYQCSLCEKAFIQRHDLVSHIRCHTGERPFVCSNCGQGFRKSSALKVHLRSHGNDIM